MKDCPIGRQAQSGIALLALMLALVLAGGYAFYRVANIGFNTNQQDTKLTLNLARAKEALIAYALIDDKRPGRMLCPDVIGDGISPLLSRDDCDGWVSGGIDIYSGWLPWKTLDISEVSDDQGTKFRYVVSRFFGGDRKSPTANKDGDLINPAINSDTPLSSPLPPSDKPQPMSLALFADNNEIVAAIIATRGELDTKNADGDEYFFNGTSKEPNNNDVITVITRQELMAVVEKRVASEVKNCLEQHAINSPESSYPWPAPLSNNIFKGQTKSLFGQVPDTQPGGNADESLQQITKDIENAQATFETPLSASNAESKYAALLILQESVAYARALYDQLYIVATDLYNKSVILAESFDTLDETLGTVTSNSAAYAAGAAGIPAAIDLAQPSLEAFRESLANSGFDIFLVELEAENAKLLAKISLTQVDLSEKNFSSLQTQVNVFKSKLFANSLTPNTELSALLSSAIDLATIAVDASKAAKDSPSNSMLTDAAISSATLLVDANQAIYRTILTIRLGIDPMDIEVLNTKLTQAVESYSAQQGASELRALDLTLSSLQSKIQLIAHGANAVMSAKTSAQSSLASATDAVGKNTSPAQIQATASSAIGTIDTLILAMQNNGDNIVQATLKTVGDLLSSSEQTPPTTLAGGKDLRALVKLVIYWADNTSAYSKTIAQKARKKPGAEEDSDSSAYIAAQRLLNSLDGESGALELLKQASNNPGDSRARSKAQTALNKTQNLLNTLDAKNTGLEAILQSSQGDAVTPIKWLGNGCNILNPPTGDPNWWISNQWKNYIFYQISDRFRSLPMTEKCVGKLKVNGAGEYCVVTISAGREIRSPNELNLDQDRESKREIGQYFEGNINADASRDGVAQKPSTAFSSKSATSTFNDRLAY